MMHPICIISVYKRMLELAGSWALLNLGVLPSSPSRGCLERGPHNRSVYTPSLTAFEILIFV